jgi:hypothetical protein
MNWSGLHIIQMSATVRSRLTRIIRMNATRFLGIRCFLLLRGYYPGIMLQMIPIYHGNPSLWAGRESNPHGVSASGMAFHSVYQFRHLPMLGIIPKH